MQDAELLSGTLAVYPADKADVMQIRELAHRIWPVCFAEILTSQQIGNMLETIYSPEHLLAEMRDGHRFWLAYKSDTPVGYASAYKKEGTVWLKKIYLEAHAQGSGLGNSLMDSAVTAFLPAKDVCLLVNRDNVRAHAFYRHKGFTKTGEVPVLMGDFPFVDYVFRKPLNLKT